MKSMRLLLTCCLSCHSLLSPCMTLASSALTSSEHNVTSLERGSPDSWLVLPLVPGLPVHQFTFCLAFLLNRLVPNLLIGVVDNDNDTNDTNDMANSVTQTTTPSGQVGTYTYGD